MARSGGPKRVVVGVQHYDTSLQGWLFDAQLSDNVGKMLWRWSNATESDYIRPNELGYLLFPDVPVTAGSHFQVLASSPSLNTRFTPQAAVRPLVPSADVLFVLVPDEARNTQSGPTAGTSTAGTGSSQSNAPTVTFSGKILGVGAEAGSTNTTTTTAPQTTTSLSTPGQTTTTLQVMGLTLTRTMHIDGIAGLHVPSSTMFG